VIICGLSYNDIITVACERLTFRDSAARLGVSQGALLRALRKRGMVHWFAHNGAERRKPGFKSRLTTGRIKSVAGLTKRDAAAELGCTPEQLGKRVRALGLGHLFPNRGKAAWLSRRGYAEGVKYE
jgi:hypothetical protein